MPVESLWDTFFDPAGTLAALECRGGVGDVIEFGCGYGTFTIPAARMIEGRVFAFDIDPDMVAATVAKAAAARTPNVIAEVRDFVADGCGVADGQAGYVMLFNILHIENPIQLLGEALRVLAPGGKVGIIHWRSDIETPRGPSAPIRPTAERCRAWGERAGLDFVRLDPLDCCAWHWGLLMRRPHAAW